MRPTNTRNGARIMSADRLAAANSALRARRLTKSFATRATPHRTGAVHRHSKYAGELETRAWRQHNVFSAMSRRARMQAVREWNYLQKEKGQSWGPLGPSGERFLDSMMGLRCFRTGRLDISIKEIAAKLHMCVQTVISYIARLEDLGLLVKLRRSRPIEDPEPGGPQVEQITNAYWFQLPLDLAERVRQLLGRGGAPVDQQEREREQAEQLEAMLKTLSAEELARFRLGDAGELARVFAALARGIDAKEGDSNSSNVTRSTRLS